MVRLLFIFIFFITACASHTVKTVYVYPTIPPLPEPPAYYKVEFIKQDDTYCITNEGAKNLLKNVLMNREYEQELLLIIQSIQQEVDKTDTK